MIITVAGNRKEYEEELSVKKLIEVEDVENIKPILADAVDACPNVTVMNRINITDLDVADGQVRGAYGFHIREEAAYHFAAKAVIVATGGAAGLYKPNHPGFSRHKMWYPPFNTGAGYAMGLRAGAEMTSFEMRFIALRCKDTIAPTGTLALGVGARQINSRGEEYNDVYGQTTAERVYGTVNENQEGRGPCYLKTEGISKEADESLLHAYLNMAPSQTIRWIENGKMPSEQNVEIEGTEPYIVGGHTASGYWVDTNRESTIKGLYAAGDVAGGSPMKFVTGALAEGEIAGEAVAARLGEDNNQTGEKISDTDEQAYLNQLLSFREKEPGRYSIEQLEEAMQTVMDEYAGGIKTNYRFNRNQLAQARDRIRQLETLIPELSAGSQQELMYVYELKDRLLVCRAVIEHLYTREETRWHSLAENTDFPERDDENWEKYVNSVYKDDEIQIRFRELVKEANRYEHHD